MQITIDKLVYGGEGLARLAPEPGRERGKTVFVPFVLPGEVADVATVESKPGFERAKLARLITPSPKRIGPGCEYYSACGGCHYQHTGYDDQLAFKSEILRETLLRTAKLDWADGIRAHPSPPWNYRNRTRMRMQHAPFALGYFKFASHDLLPATHCPISSELINRAIAAAWELGRAGKLPKSVREVEFFASAADDKLVLEVFFELGNAAPPGDVLDQEAADAVGEAFAAALPELQGVALFPTHIRRGECVSDDSGALLTWREPVLRYATAAGEYRVSAGSFFQTNRFMTDKLLELVTSGREGQAALDLYAGVGLFTVPLAKKFARVVAVESAISSVKDLHMNIPENVRVFQSTTERYLEQLRASKTANKSRPDLVIVDPPRAGLGEKVARKLAELAAPRLTYLSCDPATLSRDLRLLLESGYRTEQVDMIDLFPQTFHIESLVQLVR
ncbi:MAG: 23S rRNA (uracil(1939)-C(5))-methyltransferase RlmD [Candidatus Koribacter versatilis]|uniref:23S rRNA (Uracil(1939)-C(5))-methyltransferase RlmD n=1 Tax=Candidatus Korobacter versatilis TaxID=658062 RepID=A0A932A9P2_9BACT|nr:23S rRNA (uracil(1939)-C(5))-methyltransferase RlmD [Candidatus Koribacter versatilis]